MAAGRRCDGWGNIEGVGGGREVIEGNSIVNDFLPLIVINYNCSHKVLIILKLKKLLNVSVVA